MTFLYPINTNIYKEEKLNTKFLFSPNPLFEDLNLFEFEALSFSEIF